MLKLTDLKDKLSYNHNCIVPKLRAIGESALADKIEHCSQYSVIATCKQCGTKYYAGSNYCKSRYCAICAKLRAMAWLVKLVPLLQQYQAEGYKIFVLTLTIKDDDRLELVLDRLSKAWRVLTHDDKHCAQEFKKLNQGGVKSVEIKIGAGSGLWHPHIHSIVLCKTTENVKQYEPYRELWERATRIACGTADKVGSVHIKGLTGFDGDIVRAVVEVFKYMTKFEWTSIEDDRLRELFKVTHGRHFISAWGVLYKLKKQVEELLASSSEEQLTAHACSVCGCTEFELDDMLSELIPYYDIHEFKRVSK